LGSRHCYAFCKQQELIKSVQEINRIISKGETYEECAIILRKALDHGDSKDDRYLSRYWTCIRGWF
jgi:hypothetical protein